MSQPTQRMLKRVFDVIISVAALIMLSPVTAVIALAIKLDDRGPIFFSQERVGQDARPFVTYKFRTMVVGAEKIGRGVETARDDERITRVGRFLRHWTLDEIPQILNVLNGDMSVIGPRPTVMSQVARYTPFQRRRHEVKPGMAGWAWIHGRNRLPWDKRIELDVWYVDHWSLWLDLRIFLLACLVLIRREGIYGDDGVARGL